MKSFFLVDSVAVDNYIVAVPAACAEKEGFSCLTALLVNQEHLHFAVGNATTIPVHEIDSPSGIT